MKDLFRETFAKVSQFAFDDYLRDFVHNAPFWLLHSAAQAHADISSFAGFEELYGFLRENSRACWSDPELYPHLRLLLGARDGAFKAATHLAALQGHLGLREIDAGMFTHRYFRRHGPSPKTFELDNGAVHLVEGAILVNESEFPVVYRPVPHLFDDVVVGGITYVGSCPPVTNAQMKQAIFAAMDVIRRYDAELHRGLIEAIGMIAVTGEWSPGDRSSYSIGSNYTGGIFTSICADSPTLLAESLIHEYYHQRIWLWWLVEAPADLPGREMTMTSPVSGKQRAVSVMIQALLIYASLADYYRWAEHTYPDEAGWIRRRWKTLEAGTVELRGTLLSILENRPDCRRFVEAVVLANNYIRQYS